MIAWGWLIVTFMAGVAAGVFLLALMKANDYDELEDVDNFKRELQLTDSTVIYMTDGAGNKTKIDRYGVSVYDPETGDWRPLN